METDLLKLDYHISFPLYVCSKEIIRKAKPYLDSLDLTYTQYLVLLVLWEQDEINVKTLGERIYLDSGTLTPLLDKLESKGYIRKEVSSKDVRNRIIHITEKGIQLKEEAKGIFVKMGSYINIKPEESLFLYQILNKILKSLEEN